MPHWRVDTGFGRLSRNVSCGTSATYRSIGFTLPTYYRKGQKARLEYKRYAFGRARTFRAVGLGTPTRCRGGRQGYESSPSSCACSVASVSNRSGSPATFSGICSIASSWPKPVSSVSEMYRRTRSLHPEMR